MLRQIAFLLSGLFVVVWLALFLFGDPKGCAVPAWSPPPEITTYSIDRVYGVDGNHLRIVFLPNHETMFWYLDQARGYVEGALVSMRGVYGTHYFGPFWHLGGLETWLGYRYYPDADGSEPVYMEGKILGKFSTFPKSLFPEVGDVTDWVIFMKEDHIGFEGMWLKQEPTDHLFLQVLMERLRSPAGLLMGRSPSGPLVD